VTLLALVAWAALKPDSPRSTTPAARATATASPARSSQDSPSAGAARSSAPATGGTSSAPSGGGGAVPAGYTLRRDPSGFSIAVPSGWTVERNGPDNRFVYYRDPASIRYLLIDHTDEPKADPVADWRQQESNRAPEMPGYRRIRLERVDYKLRAADWEFTWVDEGTPVHVLNRGFVTSAHHGYAMYLYTPAGDWDSSQDELRVFQETFEAAPE
jgi:hypothetical protein